MPNKFVPAPAARHPAFRRRRNFVGIRKKAAIRWTDGGLFARFPA
ncbi:hypothetical protein [Azospirillum endophyticum]